MSIGIKPACQQRLIELLSAELPKAVVAANRFFDGREMDLRAARAALSSRDPVAAALEQYVSEDPIGDFLYHYLNAELADSREIDAGMGRVPLTSLPEYADAVGVASRVVEGLESLPWSYSIIMVAPGASSWHVDQAHWLSPDVRLWPVDDTFRGAFPLESGNPLRDAELRPGLLASGLSWSADATYLQIDVEGYFAWNTQPKVQVNMLVRALAGLGLALHLLTPGTDLVRMFDPPRPYCLVYRKLGGAWRIEQRHGFSSHVEKGLAGLELHPRIAARETEAERMEEVRFILGFIQKLLEKRTAEAKNIILAAQWLFDSHCGYDDLLCFVQTTIVVEVLLGDKASTDVVGLGVILSNRCAYLIAETRADRDQLLKDFRAIYDVRSEIVHAGKTHLTAADRRLFLRLREICARIILEEILLLCK